MSAAFPACAGHATQALTRLCQRFFERMELHRSVWKVATCELQKVSMMRKENDLRLFPKLRQNLQCRKRAWIVELDENVIQDQGPRFLLLELISQTGKSQRQVKLIPGPFTHL